MISKDARERLNAWWNHEPMDRPCILAYQWPENVPCPPADVYWMQPWALAETVHARQQQTRFFGEAVPYLYIDYGAPAVALQMGAKASWTSTETLWADRCVETADEAAELMPGGFWKQVQDEAIERGLKLCDGKAMLASYCLGAPADTTASLMGSEALLCDLIMDPDGVKRAFEANKRIIIDLFQRLAKQCAEVGTVLTGWHGIWAPDATTVIQEDFSYMIGPEMYNEFCLPHIRDIVDEVPYAFYHLDGIGALNHLPSLCAIPNLRVIQWQPGAGKTAVKQWFDVIRTILDSGKSCQLYVEPEEVDLLMNEFGPNGLLLITGGSREKMLPFAEKWKLQERGYLL